MLPNSAKRHIFMFQNIQLVSQADSKSYPGKKENNE